MKMIKLSEYMQCVDVDAIVPLNTPINILGKLHIINEQFVNLCVIRKYNSEKSRIYNDFYHAKVIKNTIGVTFL